MSSIIIQYSNGKRRHWNCPYCHTDYSASGVAPVNKNISILTPQQAKDAGWQNIKGELICPECINATEDLL